MRSTIAGVVASLLVTAGPVWAEPTTQDYVKEIQGASAGQDAGTQSEAACENGEPRDESGACPVIDDSNATRGFTLFSGSMAKPRGPTQPQAAPAPTPTATAARQVRPAQATAAVQCGLLCDLKVSFRAGSSEFTPDSRVRLEHFAEALRNPALSHKRFEIAGHTDASGNPEKNKALSQARAEAVKSFLVAHGVQASRLEAKGYGAEGLAFPGQPNDPRNRRVEARILN